MYYTQQGGGQGRRGFWSSFSPVLKPERKTRSSFSSFSAEQKSYFFGVYYYGSYFFGVYRCSLASLLDSRHFSFSTVFFERSTVHAATSPSFCTDESLCSICLVAITARERVACALVKEGSCVANGSEAQLLIFERALVSISV